MGIERHDGHGGVGVWYDVEKHMGENDFIVFCGATLGNLTDGYYRPLLHRVVRTLWSPASYFCSALVFNWVRNFY